MHTPEEKSIIEAVKKISPSVVSIIISKHLPKVKEQIFSPLFGPFNFFTQKEEAKENETMQIGGGSGFIVHSDNSHSLILTNKHVVFDNDADDIAILKINNGNLPAAELGNSSKVEIGQTVIAIGTALGMFTNTVSKGIVSGLSRKITASLGTGEQTEELRGVIQTDVAINQGNSGGPLIDTEGKVIGINTAIIFGAQNIGFSIPINWAKKDLEDIQKYGKVMKPYVGLRYIALNKKFKEKYNLPIDYGALVVRDHIPHSAAVIKNSPADRAGIKENDIILEVNGKKLDGVEFADAIQECNVGEKVKLKILRNGKDKIETEVTLEERK